MVQEQEYKDNINNIWFSSYKYKKGRMLNPKHPVLYYKKNNYDTLKNSLNMALYLNYYLRLNDKDSRTDLSNKLKKIFDNFLDIPEREIKSITDGSSSYEGEFN